MPVNLRFLAARAQEVRNRRLSYLDEAEPLSLPLSLGRVAQVRQAHLTLRIENELTLVGNPLIVGGAATRSHVLRFLWRMHPRFIRRGMLPNQQHRRPEFLESMASRFALLRLCWVVGRMAWPATGLCLKERLAVARQDSPAGDADSVPSPVAPPRMELDEAARYLAGHGYTRTEVLDLPVAFILQIFRSELLAQPDGEVDVIDPSDALLCPDLSPAAQSPDR